MIRPDLVEERALGHDGYARVVGLDEVGRGAWAGPVSVGAAVLAPGAEVASMPAWLRDSKQLSEARREAIFEEVATWCDDWSIGHASPQECDQFGMRHALALACWRAIDGLQGVPDAALLDGPLDLLHPPGLAGRSFAGPVHPVVGGDARCASVAAASVLAKVVRDRLMRQESESFPPYAFERNKGYPSPTHQTALRGYGLSAIHRRSWSYVEGLPWGDPWPGQRESPAHEG